MKPCSIVDLPYLQLCFEQLAIAQEKYNADSQPVISLLAHLAKLAGVEFELLISDVDGVLKAIAQVNFEVKSEQDAGEPVEPSDNKAEVLSLDNYHYQLVVSLVNAELAVDLESAHKIAAEIPFKDLEGYLKARVNFLNKDQDDRKEAGKELMGELADGSFFGKASDGRDPLRDGVLQAMGITPIAPPKSDKSQDDMPDSVKKAFE